MGNFPQVLNFHRLFLKLNLQLAGSSPQSLYLSAPFSTWNLQPYSEQPRGSVYWILG